MKCSGQAGILIMSAFLLSACTTFQCPPPVDASPHQDLWQESWQHYLTLPPRLWTASGDSWFFSGEPNRTERRLAKMPADQGLTVSAVKVPDLTDIRVNGCFQTQIKAGQDQTSLYIAGSHDALQQIPVQIDGKKVFIGQQEGKVCSWDMRHVIVRIGVRHLNRLAVYGGGHVEGQDIESNGLSIILAGNGDTLLAGHLPVKDILLTGSGTLTLLGVDSRRLDIEAPGNGNLRLQGRVGVRHILHTGDGDIHIAGARSTHLTIHTAGRGITSLTGRVALTAVTAEGASRVYVSRTDSSYLRIKGQNLAEIGIAGQTDTLEVSMKNCSRFWGAHLRSRVTYANTLKRAHANVTARGRLFANATDDSSIYYSATTANIAKFTAGNGLILSIGSGFSAWKDSPVWQRGYKR